MVNLVEKAIEIALQAHRGAVDKSGCPYILHPLRVALKFNDSIMQVVAILHDVIEDSCITIGELRDDGFDEDVIAALVALTRRPDESYDEFIRRVCDNSIARRVKIADIEDNLNVIRLKFVNDNDVVRLNKYLAARQILLDAQRT